MLARHPRRTLWRQLDITVAKLTFEQTYQLADDRVRDSTVEQARVRVLTGLRGELAGRLASRWVRWADTFGLPPMDEAAGPAEQLAYPYRPRPGMRATTSSTWRACTRSTRSNASTSPRMHLKSF